MTIVFTIVTLLVHFYKADFINLTVCSLAFWLLHNHEDFNRVYFRYLIVGLVLSVGYDVTWLVLRFGDMSESGDAIDRDGIEGTIKKFSLIMTVISLILKPFMAIIYWMASLNNDMETEVRALIKQ